MALSLYRSLLSQAKLLPKEKITPALQEIKSEFRKNKEINDPKKIDELLANGYHRLRFIQMITPHKPQTVSAGVWTMKSGKIEEGADEISEGSRIQNFTDANQEQLRFINEQQMKRMHYMPYESYKIPKVR